jgi:hypothetical protein
MSFVAPDVFSEIIASKFGYCIAIGSSASNDIFKILSCERNKEVIIDSLIHFHRYSVFSLSQENVIKDYQCKDKKKKIV